MIVSLLYKLTRTLLSVKGATSQFPAVLPEWCSFADSSRAGPAFSKKASASQTDNTSGVPQRGPGNGIWPATTSHSGRARVPP
jgi:hypothetical protein